MFEGKEVLSYEIEAQSKAVTILHYFINSARH